MGLLKTSKHLALRPVAARDPKENHRVATPLELLFDLIFVVAIAEAGQQLHHAIIENHLGSALPYYFMVFFALWWAWMNFTWFASAYDNDDVFYRLMTFVQITGSLIMAAGIPDVFHHQDFDIIIIGYVIMRLALVSQWFRAAKHDPAHRTVALRYAFGIIFVQMGWLLFHFSPINFTLELFILLLVLELAVPIFAEWGNPTSWHPHHIAERYSLLTIIVLGESVVACYKAIQDDLATHIVHTDIMLLMVGGLMMMFTMWWAYFDRDAHHLLKSSKHAFLWGYGHYFIFISVAAVGAALAAAVDVALGRAEFSAQFMQYIVAATLLGYTTSLWLLNELPYLSGVRRWLYPITALIIFCIPAISPHIGLGVFLMAIVYALRLIFSKCYLADRETKPQPH
ncbi:low temperature requirement protein A [Acinetobacter ursingii]|uniref:low temperature requirement protein A n=1 Tax=Acinetobacter ursingii TaxID=108980 RepID=UPI00124C2B72|nr:low temperature requirement protein A [Acinetobacter ursingii]